METTTFCFLFMCKNIIYMTSLLLIFLSLLSSCCLPYHPPFSWTFSCVHYRHGVWEGDPDPSHYRGGIRLLWPDDSGDWDRLLALLSCSDLQQHSQRDPGRPTQQRQERPWSPHTLWALEDLLPWGSGALLSLGYVVFRKGGVSIVMLA